MRFFKYGEKSSEVLAIALPGSLMRSSQVRENDEYEFIELGPGAFFLASKSYLAEIARQDLLSKLGQKVFAQSASQIAQAEHLEAHKQGVQEKQKAVAQAVTGIKQMGNNDAKTNVEPLGGLETELEKNGFLVVESEEAAKSVSKALEVQVKQGLVLGVRGFDKKFYIVTREFYEANSGKILSGTQKKECTADEVAGLCKMSADGATAVLQVMKEEGDVLEKRRGVFQLVR